MMVAAACGALLTVNTLGIAQESARPPTPLHDSGLLLFEDRIRPLLTTKCLPCHSADTEANGELLLDSRSGWEQGGASGPAIVPGRPDESRLIEAIGYGNPHLQMPPDGPLSDQELADLRRWVELGAPDPRADRVSADGDTKRLSVERANEHWAYRPILSPTIPTRPDRRGAEWSEQNPIDRFINSALHGIGSAPAPEAEASVLIRRLYHDLHGLAPTPAELKAFENDRRPDAYERLVDQLLASPRFSERIARHWLDVARYAESLTLRGFILPNAWRYRDYCVAAFGEDRSWHDMIREQLAGDLLPASDLHQQQRQIIAISFLLLGNTNLEEQDKQQLEMDLIDEQLETIGRAFLAQTVGCARCHDHKFDPIPTADYYALAGIMKSSIVLEHENVSKWIEKPLPLPPAEQNNWDELARRAEQLRRQIASLQQEIKTADKSPGATSQTPDATSGLKADLQRLQDDERQVNETLKHRPQAMAVLPVTEPKDLPIHVRGSVHQLGRVVPRGFLTAVQFGAATVPPSATPLSAVSLSAVSLSDVSLSAVSLSSTPAAPRASDQTSPSAPDRRALADWIADDRNPLTARVVANRIWYWMIGEGLVRTVDNFGTTGESPSHPELLDWLAQDLIDHDWSTKHLVRQIVLSSAYRRSSDKSPHDNNVDPDNRTLRYAHRKPVDAESMRDIMLQLSGELDLRMGGSRIPHELAADYGFVAEDPCRSIFLPMFRNSLPELLETFNMADPSVSTGQRPKTIGPQQALLMINHPWVAERASRTAQRLPQASPCDWDEWIATAYRAIFSRYPTPAEHSAITTYVGQQLQAGMGYQEVRSRVIHSLFASVDFRFLE